MRFVAASMWQWSGPSIGSGVRWRTSFDAGYRVILAEDALCSASDESHDAMLRQFGGRFSQQIEVAPVEEILDGWRAR